MYKVILSIALLLSIEFSPAMEINAVTTQLPASINDFSSPESYINYLSILGRTQPDALALKSHFSQLNQLKKQKFMRYLKDISVLETLFFSNIKPNTHKTMHGGDVVVTHNSYSEEITYHEYLSRKKQLIRIERMLVSEAEAAPSTTDRKIQDQRILEIFGIKVCQCNTWLLYRSTPKNVTSVISGGSSYAGFLPGSINKDHTEQYVYGNKAHYCTVWKVSPYLLDMRICSIHHHILGYADGRQTYRFWKGA